MKMTMDSAAAVAAIARTARERKVLPVRESERCKAKGGGGSSSSSNTSRPVRCYRRCARPLYHRRRGDRPAEDVHELNDYESELIKVVQIQAASFFAQPEQSTTSRSKN